MEPRSEPQFRCDQNAKLSVHTKVLATQVTYPTQVTSVVHLKYVSVFLVLFDFLSDVLPMFPQEFEKDDDSNGHIDFITSASVS